MIENIDPNIYFDLGTPTDIVVSNSLLNELDPLMGGHPTKFMDALNRNREKERTKSLDGGTLFHDWLDKQDQFIIADIDKPSEKIALIVEEAFKNGIDPSVWNINPEIDNIRKAVVYYNNRSIESVLKDILTGVPYYRFLESATGKVIMAPDTRNTLVACKENFDRKFEWLFDSGQDIEIYKECALLFDKTVEGGAPIKVKIKPDLIRIDHANQVIRVYDYKTTKDPVYTFCPMYSHQLRTTRLEKYRIYRQLAIYGEGLLIKYPNYTIEYYVLPIHTQYPFESMLFKIHFSFILAGNAEFDMLCSRLLFHTTTGIWDRHREEYDSDTANVNVSIPVETWGILS